MAWTAVARLAAAARRSAKRRIGASISGLGSAVRLNKTARPRGYPSAKRAGPRSYRHASIRRR